MKQNFTPDSVISPQFIHVPNFQTHWSNIQHLSVMGLTSLFIKIAISSPKHTQANPHRGFFE